MISRNSESEPSNALDESFNSILDSSKNVVSGIRSANVDEAAMISRFEKIERKHARRIQNKKDGTFSKVKSLFLKKPLDIAFANASGQENYLDSQDNADISNLENKINYNDNGFPQSDGVLHNADLNDKIKDDAKNANDLEHTAETHVIIESDASVEEKNIQALNENRNFIHEEDKIEKEDEDEDTIHIAKELPTNSQNVLTQDDQNLSNEKFLDNDDNSFRPAKISRAQRKSMRAMREEEEERPMIFFEKNNIKSMDENRNYIQQSAEPTGEQGHYSDENNQDKTFDDKPSGSINRNLIMRELFDWAKHITIAVVIGLLLVMFVIQRNVVIGSSMEPNLYENDQLIVQKVSKIFPNGISHSDIVTVNAEGLLGHSGDKNIIKRVIGVPGDTVDINVDGVYRNGTKLNETYIPGVKTSEREPAYSHVTLGDNQYYVLGDNRNVSLDSRMFGPIEKSRIIGELLIRFYPVDKFGRP